ncbi:poly(glycerol-phosphate) alpha-glucosyltransferase [Staphylococcus hyicus]|uniref:poly(glycerol-phosphate) alpha-glucosyltransferase n=1 Tax=Staphylococcus hyicus TaxID=1284 RepID=UPI00208E2A4F|nr:poly(glycerol-phosphate) alpha-glucosyltransferase [Staphylococcus hyicus]MCO4332737.1 poly(glycerol-phosphate) alpha-glucosyltransferase [Staphylococcus hyicus]MCO4335150.1 poly(glycerol-phosphate) alpha-glucosyltransferase [Staphylococcus hyicus]
MFNKVLENFDSIVIPPKKPFFISLGEPISKAKITYIKGYKNLKSEIKTYIQEYQLKFDKYPEWVKIDFVVKEEKIEFDIVVEEMLNTRRNYIDFGICLDEDWNVAFLPEVINANAFVRPQKGKDHNSLELSINNINHYLKNYTETKKNKLDNYKGRKIIRFETKGYLLTKEKYYELEESGSLKGIRKITDINEEIDIMIGTATQYLKNEITPSGMYRYGRFPHFDREIRFYNVLRHCSSTYSLIEGLSYLDKEVKSVKKAFKYIHKKAYYDCGDVAYIYDDTNGINEIKLGQNASYILSVTEYLKEGEHDSELLYRAQKVAEGILRMINLYTMETHHVLNYPDLSIKDKNRVIYYDGEAAFALLRLYQIDNNPKWLNTVILLFDKFITQNYWQYHDHWLSYCTNELVKIVPESRYIEFGLKNISHYLKFIYHRETTFPTFLEMLTSTFKLIEQAKLFGFTHTVSNHINEDFLIKVLHHRANYQRAGYFYPEIAMYFKNPKSILGSFFIKHHGYRVRIDDIEHYLSGYIQYQKLFYPKT